jgi:hypothetical protein
MKDRMKYTLASTALAVVMSSSAFAQTELDITDEQMQVLSEECRTLVQLYQDNVDSLEAGENGAEQFRERLIAILDGEGAVDCAQLRTELQAQLDETDAQQAQQTRETEQETLTERERATEQEQLTEQVEVEQEATIEGEAVVRVPEPNVDVSVPPPEVTVRQDQPRVNITQEAGSIEVQQEQPSIRVEVPEIIVRVEIPAPSIFVRTTEPNVNVASAQPDVEVQQGEPRVSVRQEEPTLDLEVDIAEGEAGAEGEQRRTAQGQEGGEARVGGDVQTSSNRPRVQVIQPTGQPEYTYDAARPQVTFRSAQPNIQVEMTEEPTVEISTVGEPQVTFESAEERDTRRQGEQQQQQGARQDEGQRQQAADQPEQQQQQQASEQPAEDQQQQLAAQQPEQDPAQQRIEQAEQDAAQQQQQAVRSEREDQQTGAMSRVAVGQLLDMEVVGAAGEDLDNPEAVLEMGGQHYIVISQGGFLGIGEKNVAIPMSRVSVVGDELRLQNLTEEEIEQARDFDFDERTALDENEQVDIRMN